MKELTHGSLFTGVGGFDEGAELAGFRNVFVAENDKWCIKYLKKRWPDGKRFYDVRDIRECPRVTVLSAGFPCQDISLARGNEGDGLYGVRSSLFFEVVRIAALALPEYVVLENSPAILGRGMWDIIAAFAKIGYCIEWQCLQASDFGYPHKRERCYMVAYPISKRHEVCVFRPLEAVGIWQVWSPTEAYLRMLAGWPEQAADSGSLCFTDEFPGFKEVIKGMGNAVMPAVAEYVFRCVRAHREGHPPAPFEGG